MCKVRGSIALRKWALGAVENMMGDFLGSVQRRFVVGRNEVIVYSIER